jgi:hypothetical protein
MSAQIATSTQVDRAGMLEFARPRHHAILITARSDGSPQASPVTCGIGPGDRIAISSYPEVNIQVSGWRSVLI